MPFCDYYAFSIGTQFVPAIVNDDRTGLSDEEEDMLDRFLYDLPAGVWDFSSHEVETVCEISESFSLCVEATYHVYEDQ